MAMNNFRMWAYAMIAIGLINWDYQRANPGALGHSLVIIVPGVLLLLATFFSATQSLLEKRSVRITWLVIGAAALAYAFLN
jgi:hypothetical protein